MFNMNKFIESVKENPAIWDVGSTEYNDENLLEKSWHNVGEKLFPDWSDLTAQEKYDHVRMMKYKWWNICNSYIKFNDNNQKDGGSEKEKNYVYAEDLKFLQPVLKSGGIRDSASEKVTQPETSRTSKIPSATIVIELVTQPHTAIKNGDTSRTPSGPPKTSSVTPRQNNTYHDWEFEQNIIQMDADRSFLLSLLPDYNKLTNDIKIDFRLFMLSFLKNPNQFKRDVYEYACAASKS